MKNFLKMFVLAGLLSILSFGVMASEHFNFITPFSDPSVSAKFPDLEGSSIQRQNTTGTANDNLTYTGTIYSLGVRGDSAAFFVAYSDYSAVVDGSVASLDAAIENGFKTADIVSVPGTFENTTLAGLFAREGQGTSDQYDAFVRDAVIGNRLYMTITVFNKSVHATQSDADEFFNSVHRN